jgi:hypothetical protein
MSRFKEMEIEASEMVLLLDKLSPSTIGYMAAVMHERRPALALQLYAALELVINESEVKA